MRYKLRRTDKEARDRKVDNSTRVGDLQTISQCNRARTQLMRDVAYWEGQIDQGPTAEHAHYGILKLKLTLRLKREALAAVQDRIARMRSIRENHVEA